jgi:hypothetical protein
MGRAIDGYYQMFLELPAMRAIWSGLQADVTLQEIDLADTRNHAALLVRVVTRLKPAVNPGSLDVSALALMTMLCGNVRLAISLEQEEADALLAATKRILTRAVEDEFFGGAG